MKVKPTTINIIFGIALLVIGIMAATPMVVDKIKPIPLDEKDVFCLARNAYYEAKGDSQMSQVAVTHVVLNRMHDGKFPKEACDVVYQKNKNENKQTIVCQFSWTCDKSLMTRRIDETGWKESLSAVQKALRMYYQRGVDVTDGSTYYHATYVNPGWRHLQRVTSIGSHIYYKESEYGSTGRSAHQKVVFRTN
jgi:spore germination cell wall hydrolase CwlJ-like protein